MKVEESLNVTFDETLLPSKTSPLEDDDLVEEEAIEWDIMWTQKSTSGICTVYGMLLNNCFLDEANALAISTTESEYVIGAERHATSTYDETSFS
ncbi:hypothetical protein Tco_0605881 [Tanacetum coccineum]